MHEIEADERAPRRRWLALAGLAVIGVGAAIVPHLDDDGTPATVASGPVSEIPAAPPRVSLDLAPGWQTFVADGDRLVVGLRPLAPADLLLAQLARDDLAFSTFPADGAVLVVGGDRLKAKYAGGTSSATQSTTAGGVGVVELTSSALVGPGPALGLGAPKTLRGGVTVRLGDVPRSGSTLAFYAGPRAPATAASAAEAMAATVKLATADPAVVPPPPPPGSRPGFDQGGVELTNAPVAAVSTSAPGVTYTVRADRDCATVGSSASSQPAGGGCKPRPAGGGAVVVTAARDIGPPPLPPPGQSFAPGVVPRWSQAMIVLVRVGPDTRRLTAQLADGRVADATVGTDGWAVVVTDGRAYMVEPRDAKGRILGQVSVA